MELFIEVDNRRVLSALQGYGKKLERPHELMRLIAGRMLAAVEDNFEEQGRPRWADLHPDTIAGRKKAGYWPGKILQRTGALKNSIAQYWDDKQAMVGANLVYARIQQLGGQTKPHTIKPKNKKALAFAGKVLKSVKHPGSNIPAHPFLNLTDADLNYLGQDVADWLKTIP